MRPSEMKCVFYFVAPADPKFEKLKAGGKPSTWFLPGRLVQHLCSVVPRNLHSETDFSIFVPMKTYGIVECVHQVFHHIWLDFFMGIEEWNKIESQNMDSSNFKI